VEVIALIVFIGYAVTYSLHIAHKYGSHDALKLSVARLDLDESDAVRFQRTEFALKSIGIAAMGSAATTIGCSTFLLFCTLTIFQKLGGVVLAVTIMSIFTALLPVPAILFCAGPLQPGKCPHIPDVLASCGKFGSRIFGGLPGGSDVALADQRSPDKHRGGDGEESSYPTGGELNMPPSQAYCQTRLMQQVPQPRGMRPSIKEAGGAQPTDGAPSLSSFGGARLPEPPADGLSNQQLDMDDVMLAENDREFNIGQESRIAPIWTRDEDQTNNSNAGENVRLCPPSPSSRRVLSTKPQLKGIL